MSGRSKIFRDRDRSRLRNLTEREAIIADAATRLAYEHAAEWLDTKAGKATAFPGGDIEHAKGRAAAYLNASQELEYWAAKPRGDRMTNDNHPPKPIEERFAAAIALAIDLCSEAGMHTADMAPILEKEAAWCRHPHQNPEDNEAEAAAVSRKEQ